MLQPFVADVLVRGEVSAVWIAGELTHCVRKTPAAGDYRVQADFGGRDEPYEPAESERGAVARTVAVAEELLGESLLFARVDWLSSDAAGWQLSELELVEPELFFRHGPHAATRLAEAWLAAIGGTSA